MQTDLKQIETWCYEQIELLNRLKSLKDFPDDVERCGSTHAYKEVHIFCGIEKIASALKLPLKINVRPGIELIYDYEKSAEHLGVKFYQIFRSKYD